MSIVPIELEPIQAYCIECAGTHQQVCATHLAPDEPEPIPPVHLADPADVQEHEHLNRLFEHDLDDCFGDMHSDDPEDDYIRAELEAHMEDTAEAAGTKGVPGQGQNQMLQDWLSKLSDTYLKELYMEYLSPEDAMCLCSTPK
ncbi:hypothetical protein FRC11_012637, partial [Ceratobasidium sp. 423]